MSEMERNRCLDTLKGLGCIFVVFIHISFPSETELGKLIILFSKFAVPIFFMISGYYAYRNSREVLLRKAKKLLFILLPALLLYFVYSLLTNLNLDFSFSQLFRVIILNDFDFMHATHLWFLPSLIYSYLIYALIVNCRQYKISYILIPVLFAFHIVVDLYLGENAQHWRNNFLLTGLPFFLLGNRMGHYTDRIREKVSNLVIIAIALAGILILGLRRLMPIDLSYSGVILYSSGLLLFAIKNPGFYIHKSLEILGKKYSLYVYIFHMLFIFLIGQKIENEWLAPVTVAIASVLFSIVFEKIATVTKKYIKQLSASKHQPS